MIVDDQRYARLGLAFMIRKAPDLRVVIFPGHQGAAFVGGIHRRHRDGSELPAAR